MVTEGSLVQLLRTLAGETQVIFLCLLFPTYKTGIRWKSQMGLHIRIFQQCLTHSSPSVSIGAPVTAVVTFIIQGPVLALSFQPYLVFCLSSRGISSTRSGFPQGGHRFFTFNWCGLYSMPEKYSIIVVIKKKKKYKHMLATSTQHCTGGFSRCNKARKEERKSIQVGKEEEKL